MRTQALAEQPLLGSSPLCSPLLKWGGTTVDHHHRQWWIVTAVQEEA
jgi:hypothetical protein